MNRFLVATSVLVASLVLACDAYRVFFPSDDHDATPPALPGELAKPAVLIFSKTNGFRHSAAIEAGIPALQAMARRNGWGMFATENGAIHQPELLARFDVVVWFQASGNVLDDAQRAALRGWIEGGGAFFGIHGTGGDGSYDWAWHPETLVAAQFIGHPMNPQVQEATIQIEDPAHPVVQELPTSWVRSDEWYSFVASPRAAGVTVLASLDESTYEPVADWWVSEQDLRMGEDHPIVWTHCIGRGRSLYSALGHPGAAYSEPLHLRLLENGIAWLARESGGSCS
jgi:type 1 glutamine amidotransferase